MLTFKWFIACSLIIHSAFFWLFHDTAPLVQSSSQLSDSAPLSVSFSINSQQSAEKNTINSECKETIAEKKANAAQIQMNKPKATKPSRKKAAGKEKKRMQNPLKTAKRQIFSSAEPQTPNKELSIGQQGAPDFSRFVFPEYPYFAKQHNIQGVVLLRVFINEKGKPEKIEVVKSAHPLLTKAAKKSIRQSKFIAAKSNGRSVSAWVRIPINFKLR